MKRKNLEVLTRNNVRNSIKDYSWKFNGILAKYFGWIIIISGCIIGVYRYISTHHTVELLGTIMLALIFGGAFLLVSWMMLPEKS